ncbi:FAD-binding oxidoreductase [Legionella bononiensis]|uniref:2Fe-2S iron-sulfur cluster binding domain-containing protein n=1 Tax=Legionella bononiensis TaxID=2793102 RepID=A0ABS1WEJ1_9GAMM|nr:FAD-binding oxidoreductase [Legionella bononiensis]MBL7479328.1 2Fe-2S iron-sulfur cluster binding domain-containing protein [Legionella bononiensis]MBL7479352.1 2Fe-2S iron-sulfur cluster binding domain-containing protein [Legionella bononiensis]MBL7527768.1 2Fe-2S iron-sulfur cluster binding domain-containing protein [Legionella bononiensis]MBL7563551.1 2Fe-2S iron-sulfur cluster binding domain-containing protein [Legionella bononiensis]
MNTITFNNQLYPLGSEENILSCLLRHGIQYPNSCQAGICQSCLIKATDGAINPSWQNGLPDTLKKQGYFLACLAKPESNINLVSPDVSECDVEAVIIGIERLNYNVLQIKLRVDNPGNWLPGQYLNVTNPEEITRSYSIANIPDQEGYIELHVKIVPNGRMSQWLQDTAKAGTSVTLRGPFGTCYYYNPDKLSFDMLLAGTGTGLAPLVGIIKAALSQEHNGSITLVHGGLTDNDIYYNDELETLAAVFKNVHYKPCVLQSQGRYTESSIEQQILNCLNNPAELRAYICGPKDTTNKLKTAIFLAGVPSKCIFSDGFL